MESRVTAVTLEERNDWDFVHRSLVNDESAKGARTEEDSIVEGILNANIEVMFYRERPSYKAGEGEEYSR
jgi:hypothetical protein